jgi:hypothetical protein
MDAANVLLIEHLPRGVKIQSITTSLGGSCTQATAIPSGTRLSCSLGLLPQGQSWTVNLAVATSIAKAKTAARISFQGTDPAPANNYYLMTMQHTASSVVGPSRNPPQARTMIDPNVGTLPVGGPRLPDQ